MQGRDFFDDGGERADKAADSAPKAHLNGDAHYGLSRVKQRTRERIRTRFH
jgi:hypothetical protein